jgi:HD-like signal output (HDOD) protein/prolyl-tRNA editing enzyme YbaK/EbsC (Cys-tRNA(Pro) deacylase)
MPLPQAVQGVLSRSTIAADTLDAAQLPEPERAGMVRPVLLADAGGKLLVLVASDSLLDLAALNRCTARELDAVPEDALGAVCAQAGLETLPALPGVLELPVIADRRLLAREQLLLDAGGDGTLVRMPAAAFRRLLEENGVASADFTLPLAELPEPAPDPEADGQAIGGAIARFTTLRIQKRLEDTLDFPPLPEVAHRIIQLGADPYASTKELAAVVEIDAGLAAQVVSWASSPYYAAPGKIRSIQDAIVRVLGFDLVMNLALGLALGKTLRLPREGRYGYRAYWLQAVQCAALVDGLGRAMPADRRPPSGFAYLGGLLHNFGFLILAELFKPQLQLVCRYTEANPHLGHWAVERFLLGVTREQMAAWLMRYWHLPEPICAALRFQQEPERAGEHEKLALLLHVAARLLRQQGIGGGAAPVPDSLLARLGVRREDAQGVLGRMRERANDLKSLARDLAA